MLVGLPGLNQSPVQPGYFVGKLSALGVAVQGDREFRVRGFRVFTVVAELLR